MVGRIQATMNSFRQEWLQASRREPIMALALWLGLATLVALALASLIPIVLSGSVNWLVSRICGMAFWAA